MIRFVSLSLVVIAVTYAATNEPHPDFIKDFQLDLQRCQQTHNPPPPVPTTRSALPRSRPSRLDPLAKAVLGYAARQMPRTPWDCVWKPISALIRVLLKPATLPPEHHAALVRYAIRLCHEWNALAGERTPIDGSLPFYVQEFNGLMNERVLVFIRRALLTSKPKRDQYDLAVSLLRTAMDSLITNVYASTTSAALLLACKILGVGAGPWHMRMADHGFSIADVDLRMPWLSVLTLLPDHRFQMPFETEFLIWSLACPHAVADFGPDTPMDLDLLPSVLNLEGDGLDLARTVADQHQKEWHSKAAYNAAIMVYKAQVHSDIVRQVKLSTNDGYRLPPPSSTPRTDFKYLPNPSKKTKPSPLQLAAGMTKYVLAPSRASRGEFWNWIHDRDVSTVVVLDDGEDYELKAKGDTYKTYYGMTVLCNRMVEFESVTILSLVLITGDERNRRSLKYVTMIQYKGLNGDIPSSEQSFMNLINAYQFCQRRGPNPGLVAVRGRDDANADGLFIAIDMALEAVTSGNPTPVKDIVTKMRKQRPGLIPTQAQYDYIHQFLQYIQQQSDQRKSLYGVLPDPTKCVA